MFDIVCPPSEVFVGRKGENEYRKIEFDVSVWLGKFPGANIVGVFRRADGAVYPISTEIVGDVLVWVPTSTDTAVSGRGELELRLLTGDTVGKTALIPTKTVRAIDATGDSPSPPPPDWINVAEGLEVRIEALEAGGGGGGGFNIHGLPAENNLADADELPFYDASAGAQRKTTWSNVKSKLKAYFDGVYVGTAAIADMATKTWVNAQGFLTQHQSLAGYATEAWVTAKNYATQAWVQAQGFITSLAGYATQVWVQSQGYGTYSKPSGGIPKTDLASAVQTSLGKADSAYQKPSGGIPASDLASGVIPTVGSGTLTIKQGGVTKGTFGANSGEDVYINLEDGGQSAFVVTVTNLGGVYTADKSYEAIADAVAAGKSIIAKFAPTQYVGEPYIYSYGGYDTNAYHVFFREEAGAKYILTVDFAGGVELTTVNNSSFNIHSLTTEEAIADADELPFYDASAAAQRKTVWSNIKEKLKTYFDTLYVGAAAISDMATKTWVNAQGFVTSLAGYATQVWVMSQGYGTYSKPSGGIPKTDLASAVQTSLGLADSALQSGDLSGYATEGYVGTQISPVQTALTSHTNNGTIHVTATNKADWSSKYSKPISGIPKTDLSSGVQDSLDLANSALQEHQSLAAYRTASAQDAIDDAQDAAIAGKYSKPASGIPASDLASGVIPTKLPSPYKLTINGTEYDGSAAVSLTISGGGGASTVYFSGTLVAGAIARSAEINATNFPHGLPTEVGQLVHDSVGALGYISSIGETLGRTMASMLMLVAAPDVDGKQDIYTASTPFPPSSTNITLVANDTIIVPNAPTALTVTLSAPTAGVDYLTGIVFKAGAGFALTDTAPTGYSIVWEDEPTWTQGTIYEISYRCLWLDDTNGDTIISAKYAEVTA